MLSVKQNFTIYCFAAEILVCQIAFLKKQTPAMTTKVVSRTNP